jgi:nucleoside 2-deoxyribosyltransferase
MIVSPYTFSRLDPAMADEKVVFIAFAKEDEGSRNLFTGQRVNASTPFSFTDMSVKEPYESEWKQRVQTRIRRSDGVIALISANTPRATGQLWEIKCAVAEGKPLLGIWLDDNYRTKPPEMGNAPCKTWTWPNVAAFIDNL